MHFLQDAWLYAVPFAFACLCSTACSRSVHIPGLHYLACLLPAMHAAFSLYNTPCHAYVCVSFLALLPFLLPFSLPPLQCCILPLLHFIPAALYFSCCLCLLPHCTHICHFAFLRSHMPVCYLCGFYYLPPFSLFLYSALPFLLRLPTFSCFFSSFLPTFLYYAFPALFALGGWR